VLIVYYNKFSLKFALHHFLLYVVYMCQKSLNFTIKNVSWPHFSWTTLYNCSNKAKQPTECFILLAILASLIVLLYIHVNCVGYALGVGTVNRSPMFFHSIATISHL